jgi:branched-chain amino acid transport system permease protein
MALGVGAVVLRRLRGDYEAIVLLILSLIATGIANAQLNLVNGPSGLSAIPQPLASALGLSPLGYQWAYLAWTAFLTALIVWAMRRLTASPFGRTLRAMRENEVGIVALGRSSTLLRIQAFVIGGIVAGISGAVLVEFVGAWAPGSWLYPETFSLLTAIIIGGRGSLRGALAGTLIVPVLFLEVTRFLPQIGYAGLTDSLAWVVVGLLTIAFLWFRPQGLFPERPQRFPRAGAGPAEMREAAAPRVTADRAEGVP